jgi:hypothetical protein
MSKFFNSELIQEELRKINELQEFLYGSALSFGSMTRESKLEHIEKLELLLEKQKIMYTRLSLSDDPQAIEMKENLKKSVLLMGFPPETDMNLIFGNMFSIIKSLRKYLDD